MLCFGLEVFYLDLETKQPERSYSKCNQQRTALTIIHSAMAKKIKYLKEYEKLMTLLVCNSLKL